MKCDPGTYVSLEAPKFCCRHPRMQIESTGEKAYPKAELCGDLLAEFDPSDQKIRWKRGPDSDATPENFAHLQAAGMGAKLPSAVTFEAMKEGHEWKLLLGSKCKGRDGTLIVWPTGRAEFCPSGSTPVHGDGYMSWQCDGMYKKEESIFCCKVNGLEKCVPNMVDQAASLTCNCPGVGGASQDSDEDPKKGEVKKGSLSALAVLLLASSWQQARGSDLAATSQQKRGAHPRLGHDFL